MKIIIKGFGNLAESIKCEQSRLVLGVGGGVEVQDSVGVVSEHSPLGTVQLDGTIADGLNLRGMGKV